MAFRVGDVVKLKSGSPLMTVTTTGGTVGGKEVVGCAWFDGTKPAAEVFPPDTLELAAKPSAAQIASKLAR